MKILKSDQLIAAIKNSHITYDGARGWKILLSNEDNNQIQITKNRLVKEAIKLFKNDPNAQVDEKVEWLQLLEKHLKRLDQEEKELKAIRAAILPSTEAAKGNRMHSLRERIGNFLYNRTFAINKSIRSLESRERKPFAKETYLQAKELIEEEITKFPALKSYSREELLRYFIDAYALGSALLPERTKLSSQTIEKEIRSAIEKAIDGVQKNSKTQERRLHLLDNKLEGELIFHYKYITGNLPSLQNKEEIQKALEILSSANYNKERLETTIRELISNVQKALDKL